MRIRRSRRLDEDYDHEHFLGFGDISELRTRRMTKAEKREHAERQPIGFMHFQWQKPKRRRDRFR